MIRYTIFQTTLANKPSYFARVIPGGYYDLDKLVTYLATLKTSLSKEDLTSTLQLLATAVKTLCSQGYIVRLDNFIRFSPAISGGFDKKSDGFIKDRNQVYVNATMGSGFNAQFGQETSIEKSDLKALNGPVLDAVNNLVTGTDNLEVTKGHIVSIEGNRLKFNQDNPAEYLHFVNSDNPTEFVPITLFHRLNNQEATFLMPAVPFTKGYFEMVNNVGTSTPRMATSNAVQVI